MTSQDENMSGTRVELKHKWRVARDAWYIGLYLYAWSFYSLADRQTLAPSERDINFCNLFWGFLLMPLAFLVLKPAFHVVDAIVWLVRRIPRRRRAEASRATVEPAPKRDPSRVLTWVSELFVRLSLRLQAAWLRIRKPVLWATFALAALVAVGASTVIVYFAATNLDVVLLGLGYGTGGILGAAALILAVAALDRAGFWRALAGVLKRVFRLGGRKVKHGTLGFFGAMRVGYYAVKTNTCPEIVLEAAGNQHSSPPSDTQAGRASSAASHRKQAS